MLTTIELSLSPLSRDIDDNEIVQNYTIECIYLCHIHLGISLDEGRSKPFK